MATTPETNTEVGHIEAHGSGVFPPFDASTFGPQLLSLAIIFGLLYLLMSKLALPRVEQILETRRAKHEGDLAEAGRLKTESEAALATFEKTLADARASSQKIAGETRDALNVELGAERKKFDTEISAKLSEADQRIAIDRTKAMTNVASIAVDTAEEIISRIINQKPARSDVESAVQQSVKA
jgi:F-type H+-transporting ATPase subunit b